MTLPTSLADVPFFRIGYTPNATTPSLTFRTPDRLSAVSRVLGVSSPDESRYLTWPDAADPAPWSDFAPYTGDGTDVPDYTLFGYVGGPYWPSYAAQPYVGFLSARLVVGETWQEVLAAALASPAAADYFGGREAWIADGAAEVLRFPGRYEGFAAPSRTVTPHLWSGHTADAGYGGRPPSPARATGSAYYDEDLGAWVPSASVDWPGDGYDPENPPAVTVSVTVDPPGAPPVVAGSATVVDPGFGEIGVTDIDLTGTIPGDGTESVVVSVTIAEPSTVSRTDDPPTGWGDAWAVAPTVVEPITYPIRTATGASWGMAGAPLRPWVQWQAGSGRLIDPTLPATVARIDDNGPMPWGTPRGDALLSPAAGGSIGAEVSVRIDFRTCERRDYPGGWRLVWTQSFYASEYADAIGDYIPVWVEEAACPAWAVLGVAGSIDETWTLVVEPYQVTPPAIAAGTIVIACWESAEPEDDSEPGYVDMGFEAPAIPWAMPIVGGAGIIRPA